ncbi:MAG: VTT domain-containing protein [Myxococcota bacterium]|nr:VTT domain-containing protein [Myxococcota bacterium]
MSEPRELLGIPPSRWALLGGVVLALAALSLLVRDQLSLEWSVESLRALVSRAGLLGPVLYVGILTLRFAVLVPSSILLAAAGLCFGAVPGTLYATIGLTLSALLKFAVASIAGRDFLLRQLPKHWSVTLAVGDRRATAGGLALVCAYPFGPKHVFQIAAILSGMSLWKYAAAVASGAKFRAGAFAVLGEAVATGQGVVGASALLLVVGAIPLAVPRWRAWLFSAGAKAR